MPKETERKAKVQEKVKAKAKERVKMITEQIRPIRIKLIKPVNNVVSITKGAIVWDSELNPVKNREGNGRSKEYDSRQVQRETCEI